MRNYSHRFDFSSPATFAPVLLACVVCWIVSYLYSVGYPVYGEVSATPLWNAICEALPGKEFAYAIGMALMFGGAFLLHRANYVLVLIREKTMLPFLFYVLFISTNPDFFPLKPTSVGVFCLILAIYRLFTTYHDPAAVEGAYSAALLIGIGSLLWIHLLWFLPLFWLGMYNFRSLSPRTFTASLLGVATVYWFLLGWCVWQRDFTPFSHSFSVLFKIRFLIIGGFMSWNWSSILVGIALTVAASMNIIMHDAKDSLRSRQFLFFLIIMAVWSFGLYFLYEQVSEEFLETAIVPASILIAHFFTVARGRVVPVAFYSSVVVLMVAFFVRIWNFL